MRVKAVKSFQDGSLGGWVPAGRVFEIRDKEGFQMLGNRIVVPAENEPITELAQPEPRNKVIGKGRVLNLGPIQAPRNPLEPNQIEMNATPVVREVIGADIAATAQVENETPELEGAPRLQHVILAPDADDLDGSGRR